MSTPEEFYRVLVQKYLKAGELAPDDYEALEIDRAHLGLLPATARAIEQELLNPAQTTEPILVRSSETTGLEPEPVSSPPNLSLSSSSLNPQQVLLPRASSPDRLHPFFTPVRAEQRSTGSGKAPEPAPDKTSADFIAHRQQYKEELLQALQKEGFLLSKDTNAHLNKLEEQFRLDKDDVTEILQEVMREITTNPSRPPQPSSSPEITPQPSQMASPDETPTVQSVEAAVVPAVAPPHSIYQGNLGVRLEQLNQELAGRNFRAADQITYNILLQVIKPDLDWFNEASLEAFLPQAEDKQVIQEIDRLWSDYNQNCGFSQQRLLFGALPPAGLDARRDEKNRLQTLEFSKGAQWWLEPLGFYKFYDQLDFSTQAPQGHLPALWFWQIPRRKAFDYGNLGILAQRGGCRLEEFTLPAFMRMLKRCGIGSEK